MLKNTYRKQKKHLHAFIPEGKTQISYKCWLESKGLLEKREWLQRVRYELPVIYRMCGIFYDFTGLYHTIIYSNYWIEM